MRGGCTSSAPISVPAKLRELAGFFWMMMSAKRRGDSVSTVFRDLAEYDEALQCYSRLDLAHAKVLEIGFGARPFRLIALMSLGVDACGADPTVPVLRGRPGEFVMAYRRNGGERALKSFVRFICFDLLDRSRLRRELARRGHKITILPERFLAADGADLEFPEATFDLIFSEDVFEHVPPASLRQLVSKMASWLKPTGIALIRPNIFAGISGGHLAEWFPALVRRGFARRKSEPWEHLRKNRYSPNTYLNGLSRANYRALFSEFFAILEERVRDPDLGRAFLTPEVSQELRQYPEEELLSNQVLFVLGRKR